MTRVRTTITIDKNQYDQIEAARKKTRDNLSRFLEKIVALGLAQFNKGMQAIPDTPLPKMNPYEEQDNRQRGNNR